MCVAFINICRLLNRYLTSKKRVIGVMGSCRGDGMTGAP